MVQESNFKILFYFNKNHIEYWDKLEAANIFLKRSNRSSRLYDDIFCMEIQETGGSLTGSSCFLYFWQVLTGSSLNQHEKHLLSNEVARQALKSQDFT